MRKKLYILSFFLLTSLSLHAQGFLHADGKNIVNGQGENIILRGIGTGNWLLQEGYMMRSTGAANTHTEFRKKLNGTIGTANTESFYDQWLKDHMRRIDVDSMAAWGFNSVRVAMHYKWLTLPIEEEEIPGQNTWLEPGFIMLDSLLSWCSDNEMYLILDMHGTPGGQGKNADISDYDSTKLSLWESNLNKSKLVALWYKLADRYSDEPWIGGYDLINETNWWFPEGNNSQMRSLYQRITDTIRLVDNKHIIYIEGNGFANDFSGLTPPWDNNMVYSFHKYWSYNTETSLDWVISLRDQYNVPLWLGESGENSNTWFTNLISLAERKNIGWSWWPVKKVAVNNPLSVKMNSAYANLLDYWRGYAPKPSLTEAYQAVLQFSDNHRFENCIIQRDVIDAMMRQPFTNDILPYKIYNPEDYIYAVDYAIGKVGYAYYDLDTADYHIDTDEYRAWNKGYQYRNDGVDIEVCKDTDNTNGYGVGFVEDGEWMIYTLYNATPTLYDCQFRASAKQTGGYAVLELNDKVISEEIYLPATGDWQSWRTSTSNDILLPAGDIELKVRYPKGGSNVNYFRFTNPRPAAQPAFKALYCETAKLSREIFVHLNKEITTESLNNENFKLYIDNILTPLSTVKKSEYSDRVIVLTSSSDLLYDNVLKLSYNGNAVHSGEEDLETFSNKLILNILASHHIIPGKMEAEDFYENEGIVVGKCEDTGKGYNTGYAHSGDYLNYIINVPQTGQYQADFRIATNHDNSRITLYREEDDRFIYIKSFTFNKTGGWQNWETQSTSLRLVKGKYRFRIYVDQGEHNLNWIDFSLLASVNKTTLPLASIIYPNPARDHINIIFSGDLDTKKQVELFDIKGTKIWAKASSENQLTIDTSHILSGTYFLRIYDSSIIYNHKLLIN